MPPATPIIRENEAQKMLSILKRIARQVAPTPIEKRNLMFAPVVYLVASAPKRAPITQPKSNKIPPRSSTFPW